MLANKKKIKPNKTKKKKKIMVGCAKECLLIFLKDCYNLIKKTM